VALTKLTSARDFLKVWFYWRKHALFIFFLIVAVVLAYSYFATPVYESTAKVLLLPRSSESTIISSGSGTEENRITPLSAEDINTEIELLKSDSVLKETVLSVFNKNIVLNNQQKNVTSHIISVMAAGFNETLLFLGLKQEISEFDSNVFLLKKSVEVKAVPRSNIIRVILRSESPQTAATVLNTLLETYIKHHNDVFTKEEGGKFFLDQAEDYHEKLKFAEQKLKQYEQKWNIVDLKSQNEANIELLSETRKELNSIEISIDEAESRLTILKKSLGKNHSGVIITKEMRTIPAIVELEKATIPLLLKRSEILKTYTPESREYRDIQLQITALRKEMRAEVLKAIQTDELELESLQIRKNSLENKIRNLMTEANNLSQKENELKNLEREVNLFHDNYILYASKAEDARIYNERKKRHLANVNIADRANIPLKPAFPKKILLILSALLIGLFAALGLPFVLNLLDQRIKTANEAEELLSLPVICSFPDVKSTKIE
jgi:uncharacterized protein involved in exopolysaccharide biosynthesis